MADPRTKEELIHIIEKFESESENYKEFKESLTDLNRDIDELMKPGKEGWKLLDENTFLPFYDKYLKTAKKLSAFLNEKKDTADQEERILWNTCEAFRMHFVNDMAIMRSYSTELGTSPKSLPTLFENSKVSTVVLNNNNVATMGCAMSTRIPMMATRNNGEAVEGFFTKAAYYDPLKGMQEAMNKASASTKNPVEVALLKNFAKIFKAFCREKGYPEDQEPKVLDLIAKTAGEEKNRSRIINPDEFLNIYSRMIGRIGFGEAAELTGLSAKQFPANKEKIEALFGKDTRKVMAEEMGKAWNASKNMQMTGIAPNSRIDTRNVAMSNVAQLLGMDGIVCRSRMMKLKDRKGNVTEGIFMEKARGVDANGPGSNLFSVDGNQLKSGDGHCLKQLADLQVLDYICGNPDRHGGNMFYEFNGDGELIGIQGIDNDLSFGGLKTTNGILGFMMPPQYMGAISKGTADRILAIDPEVLAYSLYGILDTREIDAAKFRLEQMQEAIKISRVNIKKYQQEKPGKLDQKGISIPYGVLREIADEDWKNVNMNNLFHPRDGVKNIFVEVKETLDTFAVRSLLPSKEVQYVSVETANRAEGAGVYSGMKRAAELGKLFPEKNPSGTPKSYKKVAEEVKKHEELLKKIFTRMESCKKRVQKDTAETGDYFGQYVTKDDLEKIRKSEERLRSAVTEYCKERKVVLGKEDKIARKANVRDEIEKVTEVYDFIKNAQTRRPEEDETVKANHRKAVEEITRAIMKNPEGRAAGPKNPENPAKKAAATAKVTAKKTGAKVMPKKMVMSA